MSFVCFHVRIAIKEKRLEFVCQRMSKHTLFVDEMAKIAAVEWIHNPMLFAFGMKEDIGNHPKELVYMMVNDTIQVLSFLQKMVTIHADVKMGNLLALLSYVVTQSMENDIQFHLYRRICLP